VSGKLSSPSVVRAELAARGIRLRKSLGQHFLVDENTLRAIATACAPQAETVVEVGAGIGTLTVELAQQAAHVLAVEIDERLVPLLRDRVARFTNCHVLHADARDLELSSFGDRLLVVGNLPYSITSDMALKLIRERDAVARAVFLIQREVAERWIAPPGSRASRLGVHLRAYYDLSLLRHVPRTVFYPPPDVASALIRLARRERPRIAAPAQDFERVLAAAFATRRKTLRRSLRTSATAAEIDAALEAAGIDGRRRGETLSFEELDALAQRLGEAHET